MVLIFYLIIISYIIYIKIFNRNKTRYTDYSHDLGIGGGGTLLFTVPWAGGLIGFGITGGGNLIYG